ncbi:MAG: M23 family metallopeptidase [Pseudomonadota bacterium]|nr:M23 family metallopeptidase [Pseudomonadota bacterium]
MKKITLVLIPDGTDMTRSFAMPQLVLRLAALLGLAVLFAAVFFALDYIKMHDEVRGFSKLKVEHHSLQAEVRILNERLGEVKQSLRVVGSYTDQLNDLMHLNNKKARKHLGIGALTEDEYEEFKKSATLDSSAIFDGVKISDMVHSDLFSKLTEIENSAHQNIFDMQRLLSRLGKKRSLLSSIPAISPVDGWVSSGFGYRTSPFTGKRQKHYGIDIATSVGKPIYAPADGVVIFSGTKEGFGNFIMIAHGHGVVTRYGHNAHNLVVVGQRIARGDQIATVGSTGRSTGAHLHYEVWVNGRPTNPKKFILSLGKHQLF